MNQQYNRVWWYNLQWSTLIFQIHSLSKLQWKHESVLRERKRAMSSVVPPNLGQHQYRGEEHEEEEEKEEEKEKGEDEEKEKEYEEESS